MVSTTNSESGGAYSASFDVGLLVLARLGDSCEGPEERDSDVIVPSEDPGGCDGTCLRVVPEERSASYRLPDGIVVRDECSFQLNSIIRNLEDLAGLLGSGFCLACGGHLHFDGRLAVPLRVRCPLQPLMNLEGVP